MLNQGLTRPRYWRLSASADRAAKPPVDGPALGQLVTDAHFVQRELASLPEHTFSEAQKILTVEQQAKLLLFRRDLQGEVRQAIRRRGTTPAAAPHHSH